MVSNFVITACVSEGVSRLSGGQKQGVVPFFRPYPLSPTRVDGIGDRRERNCPLGSDLDSGHSLYYPLESVISQRSARNIFKIVWLICLVKRAGVLQAI